MRPGLERRIRGLEEALLLSFITVFQIHLSTMLQAPLRGTTVSIIVGS